MYEVKGIRIQWKAGEECGAHTEMQVHKIIHLYYIYNYLNANINW